LQSNLSKEESKLSNQSSPYFDNKETVIKLNSFNIE
jgi:hypothetical protein